ncbi:hypothetical protein [Burkholderia lata]|uniref:hypothetical protein n=1 Tax=Burkholderia lata (strain ATCC 17760 / DSM 23089 / LMG 22485 / NCIMB 9086 / R18194 / 383) TaxID=482957 RepID=UPI001582B889|nr:hypothetical protein [Burkholderia lata]
MLIAALRVAAPGTPFHTNAKRIHMHLKFNQDSNPVDLIRTRNQANADWKITTVTSVDSRGDRLSNQGIVTAPDNRGARFPFIMIAWTAGRARRSA